MKTGRLLTWLGLLLGSLGLLVQFVLAMHAYLAQGRDIPGALGTFFSYYTILTNIVLVLIYASAVSRTSVLTIFRHPVVRGGMAANMVLVAAFVYLVLRHLTTLTGLSLICDLVLHYATPLVYCLWWARAATHGVLGPRNLGPMLAPTFYYFIFAMVRGAWVKEYPYPILNAQQLGYPQVFLNAVEMTLALLLLCLAVIAVDRGLATNPKSRSLRDRPETSTPD